MAAFLTVARRRKRIPVSAKGDRFQNRHRISAAKPPEFRSVSYSRRHHIAVGWQLKGCDPIPADFEIFARRQRIGEAMRVRKRQEHAGQFRSWRRLACANV